MLVTKLAFAAAMLVGRANADHLNVVNDLCEAKCQSNDDGEEICTFTSYVDLSASEFGYYKFEECGDQVNPTLAMELSKVYKFVQTDRSNYYHPLGFAYYPDGAHDNVSELEPGIPPPGSSSTCGDDKTCPAPMYFVGGNYKGKYSNIETLVPSTTGEDNFGLDDYEPLFFRPMKEWVGYGDFEVQMTFPEYEGFGSDIFYFCHIHQYMSGRIKLTKNGMPIQPDSDLPVLPYKYDMQGDHDRDCGTYGLDDFQLPNPQCPVEFVCDAPRGLSYREPGYDMQLFSNCINSMNCAMMVGMTTSVSAAESEEALFLHNMIPHHQNAVNMAKSALYFSYADCYDLIEESDECTLEVLLRSIINNQNHQIQTMNSLLESGGWPKTDDCYVPFMDNGKVSVAKTRRAQTDTPIEDSDDLCQATCATDDDGVEVCTFTTKVDLFAGELGYYTFEECGDKTNPTLAMEIGKTYQFVQTHRSNYYHPLGFAYYADGAHDDVKELEPGIPPPESNSTCGNDMTCPAPMYFLGDKYPGTYSNIEALFPNSTGEVTFGLDDYEPLFFHPISEWAKYNPFSVYLKFDDHPEFTQDIFYFCHIHQYMTGRIKLTKGGEPIQPNSDLPEIPYEYDTPVGHDAECGTYGLEAFQLPNAECPEKFVCDVPADNVELTEFSMCIESMNCAMIAGMTTKVSDHDGFALFYHQMIPHHQNGVNMAKVLLNSGKLVCDDLTDEESAQADDCAMERLSRSIINVQNHEIQIMNGLLESGGYPESEDCVVLSSPPGVTILVEIRTDDHPTETSWTLTDTCPGGSTVAIGGGYTEKGKLERSNILTRKSRFLFVILDNGGDGVCCNTGPKGSYKVFLDSDLQVQGGEFGYDDFKYFGECTGAPVTSKPTDVLIASPTNIPSNNPTSLPTDTPTNVPTLFQSTNKASYDSSLGALKCGTVHSSGICTTTGTGLLTKKKKWGELNGPNTLDKCIDGSSGSYLNDESVESITVTAIGGGVLKAGGKAQVTARVHAFSQNEDMVDFYYSSTPGTNPNWEPISSTQPSSSKFSEVNSTFFFLPKTGTQAVRAIIRWTLENGSVAPCPGGEFSDVDDLVFVVDTSSASLSYDLPVGPVEMPLPLPMPQVECAGFVSGRCVAANTCKWDGKDCSPMN